MKTQHHTTKSRFGVGILLLFIGMYLTGAVVLSIPLNTEKIGSLGPRSQNVPQFSSPLSVNDTIFSPQNQDGYRDHVEFSFTPSIDSTYNFTIEEDSKMVDYNAASASIAGNNSILHMVYVDTTNPSSVASIMYYRNSTNNGLSWSTPVKTNLIYPYNSDEQYWHLDLELNESDGSFYLLATHNGYFAGYDISLYNSTDGIDNSKKKIDQS
jgi:hypothetical protein